MKRVPSELVRASENGDHEAIEAIRQKADDGEPDAQYWLGWLYWEGTAFQQDIEQGARWFQRAADAGHTIAQFNIATAHLQGNGVPKNAVEALRWSRRAAEAGYADAQFMLAVLYSKGQLGIPCDLQESVKWCKRAAERGHRDAPKLLSILNGERPARLTPEERFDLALGKLQKTRLGREHDQAIAQMAIAANEGADNARHFFQEAYRQFLAAAEDSDFDVMAKAVGFLSWLLQVSGHPDSNTILIASTPLMQSLVGGSDPDTEAIAKFESLIVSAAGDGNKMAAMLLDAAQSNPE